MAGGPTLGRARARGGRRAPRVETLSACKSQAAEHPLDGCARIPTQPLSPIPLGDRAVSGDAGRPAASAARRSSTRSSISACRRCARATCRRIVSTRWSRSIRSTPRSASSCLLVQLEEFVTADEIFSEYAYFSSYSDSWVEHARTLRRDGGRSASASTTRASSWSWPATTATCCSTSSRAGSRRSASSPPPTSPRWRASEGIETVVEFFGRDLAPPAGG